MVTQLVEMEYHVMMPAIATMSQAYLLSLEVKTMLRLVCLYMLVMKIQ